jgi:hypothetical protein
LLYKVSGNPEERGPSQAILNSLAKITQLGSHSNFATLSRTKFKLLDVAKALRVNGG